MSFQEKYLKYKNKYLSLKNNLNFNQYGGTIPVGTIVSFDYFEQDGASYSKVKKYGKVLGPVNKLNIGFINNIVQDEIKIEREEEILESKLTVVSIEEVDIMRAKAKKRIEEIERELQKKEKFHHQFCH
jgi:hypothetical protein